MTRRELVVVGAGALGAATAWQATELGLEDVLVLDRAAACSGTSPLGAGLVNRLLWRPEEVGFVERSIVAFRKLDEAADAFTYHGSGGLLVVGPEHEREAERMLRVWRAQGIEVGQLAPDEVDELASLEGLELAPDERAFLSEGDGWAVTTDTVQAMLERVEEAGGRAHPHTPVARVEDRGVLLEGGERVEADAVVVAAGVWTPNLFPDGWRPPIQAYRAQAAVLQHGRGRTPGPCVHDTPNHTYWRPEGPAKLVMGNGTDLNPHDVGDEARADADFPNRMVERLTDRWPAAKGATLVRAWAGLAAGTPDARPLVGAVPGREGVYLCAGGNGFGYMRSPALGEVAAHLVLGRRPPLPVEGIRPGRFEDPPESFEMEEGFALD